MADLLTKRELALWTQRELSVVAADQFATDVISKVSEMAQFLGGHPLWSLEPGDNLAPFDVRMVVLQVCKRTYGNPDQVVQEGGIGPIGGDRFLDAAALLTSLTESERATLTKYNEEGDPDGQTELFILRINRDAEPSSSSPILYVSDDQQVGMDESESAYPSWDIPLFNPGDPGDPNLYPED